MNALIFYFFFNKIKKLIGLYSCKLHTVECKKHVHLLELIWWTIFLSIYTQHV